MTFTGSRVADQNLIAHSEARRQVNRARSPLYLLCNTKRFVHIEGMTPEFITRAELDIGIERVRERCADPVVGLYGPDSMIWRISRHSALFAGSWQAVLLQLAHPWVANAIQQHSRTMKDPLGRFHGTFRVMFSMVFGSLDQAITQAIRLHEMHSRITGTLDEGAGRFATGSAYQANAVEAMFWVQATLWQGSIAWYEQLVEPLSDDEKERYYAEAKVCAFLFGIPESIMPSSWKAFEAWFEETLQSDLLGVGEIGREVGDYLFKLDRLPWTKPGIPTARLITGAALPAHLREGFGLPAPAPKKVARRLRLMKSAYRLLPRRVAYIPPYFEALCRVNGLKKCDALT
ncbi:MAG: hypothetical protein ACI9TH_002209, partial [Kiritimatiellia bacterium]